MEAILNLLSQAFVKDIEPDTINIMAKALKSSGMTPDDLRSLLPEIIKRCRFFPSVAEILELHNAEAKANVAYKIIDGIKKCSIYDRGSLERFLGHDLFQLYCKAGGERLRMMPEDQVFRAIKSFMNDTAIDRPRKEAIDSRPISALLTEGDL